jgi:hypothetical protein
VVVQKPTAQSGGAFFAQVALPLLAMALLGLGAAPGLSKRITCQFLLEL